MKKPPALVITGYGINCDDETAFAFSDAGAEVDIRHINDIIENRRVFDDYKILSFPGGFSYGDDTGSGRALANKIKNNLIDEIMEFAVADKLILGICNGFQVMANIGLVPFPEINPMPVAVSLEHNNSYRYQCRWVDLIINSSSPSVFTRGIKSMRIPVAHGEGNFFALPDVLDKIEKKSLAVIRYAHPDGRPADREFPFNPNGSVNDIAGICDSSGRVMGMMPHPERAVFFTQRDDWTLQREQCIRNREKIPLHADGRKIFENAIEYFL